MGGHSTTEDHRMTESATQHPESQAPEGAAPAADETFAFDAESHPNEPDGGRTAAAGEWMTQLQSMIDNVATHAGPAMREIGAKAAELAALAGEKAGPFAKRAADATAEAGTKLAERGRVVAADLRRDAAAAREATNGTTESAPAEDEAEPVGTTSA
jgi:hypothetical protein